MDGVFRSAGNSVTAVVVRQFTPSRIERQLLARVFELVCEVQGEIQQSSTSEPSTVRTHDIDTHRRAIQTHVGRRRVA